MTFVSYPLGFLPEMFLHLRVDESSNIASDNSASTFLVASCAQIRLEMLYRLRCKVVKQVGMVVVGDVVKVHQSANNVVFQSLFFDAASAERDRHSCWPVLRYCTPDLLGWLRIREAYPASE